MFPATVGPVYWKMITYCVPNDKSAQWHVALLSWPDPSLIVSVVSFLYATLALICRNDRPHMRGTNRIPSASLSLSSLRPPHCHLHPLYPLSSSPQPVAPGESKTWFKPRTPGFCQLEKWHHHSRKERCTFCRWQHTWALQLRFNVPVFDFAALTNGKSAKTCVCAVRVTQRHALTALRLFWFEPLWQTPMNWVIFPPPSSLSLSFSLLVNCPLTRNTLSWCLCVSSKSSPRFDNTKYRPSSHCPPSSSLTGSHLCTLVTQSAPSPPELADQQAQALRVSTAGV